jgi:arylformamidase
MKIIDITQEVFTARIYPGDTPPSRKRARQMPDDEYNLTDIAMCVHNGTHVDAPLHFIENGAAIDALPLDIFFGPCAVAQFSGSVSARDVASFSGYERLLIKGDAEITLEAAQAIAASGIKLLGVENQSVGPANTPMETHLILLGKSVALLEGLDLQNTEPGEYILSALPLKLGGCEGAPARAVLIKDESPAGKAEAFDRILSDLANRQRDIPAELERLRAERKEKTVRFKELMAQKLMDSHTLMLFARYGIKAEKR